MVNKEPVPNLERWFVCPVMKTGGATKGVFLDRTQGFLICSNQKENALSTVQVSEPEYVFTGEVIPYKDYIPGLSLQGMVIDLQRWVGFKNHLNDVPFGSVFQMD